MAECTFKVARGGSPAEFILALGAGIMPTVGDALYAAQRQRTRIVDRTLAGVDVNGVSFEPYSTNGPYYYYPTSGGRAYVGPMSKTESKRHTASRKAAVNRLLKITQRVSEDRAIYQGTTSVGGVRTKSGLGIRFESYADFKASLGRMGVDLTGPRAPHMLQAIIAGVNGQQYGVQDLGTAMGGRQQIAEEFSLGIYGEPAARAIGHNTGINPRWKRRHQRFFLGASDRDIALIIEDIAVRINARLNSTPDFTP